MAKIVPIGGMTCPECEGKGIIIVLDQLFDCQTCDGKGWILTEVEDEYEKP